MKYLSGRQSERPLAEREVHVCAGDPLDLLVGPVQLAELDAVPVRVRVGGGEDVVVGAAHRQPLATPVLLHVEPEPVLHQGDVQVPGWIFNGLVNFGSGGDRTSLLQEERGQPKSDIRLRGLGTDNERGSKIPKIY